MRALIRLLLPITGTFPPPWYYQSKAWHETANRVRKERGKSCQCCHGKGWEVHHLTYKRCPGKELDRDLLVLCRRCHWCAHRAKFLLPLRWMAGILLHG
jgi:hypothetical protein